MNSENTAQVQTPTQTSENAKEKAIVFSKVSQVVEIMREVDRLKLPVLVRYSRAVKAVRAFVASFSPRENEVVLAGISEQGTGLLARSAAVKVEFILLSKKIVFVAPVARREVGKIILRLPEKVIAIERRNNVRFKVSSSNPAFVRFPDKVFDYEDVEAPFLPRVLRSRLNASPMLRIDDVSLGGVAGFTRYGALQKALKGTEEQVRAVLYFPNCYPIKVPVSVRWSKKTILSDTGDQFEPFKNLVRSLAGGVSEEDLVMKESFHRVGIQFAEVSRELDGILRSFMKMVQQAESV